MKNKKAQLGKGIVFLPVLILLIILLAVYLFISSSVSVLHKPKAENAYSSLSSEDDLLLQKIKIPINNQEKEFLVLDAYILFEKKIIEKKTLNNALKAILEENKCLVLSTKITTLAGESVYADNFYLEKIKEEIDIYSNEYNPSVVESYKNNNILNSVLFENGDIEKHLEYYQGDCIY